MEQNQDRLTLLKGRYLAQIKSKETEIEELRTKVRLLDEIDAEAQKFLSLGDNDLNLKGEKMVKAAQRTVNSIGTNGGVTISDVADYMKAHGFEFVGENYKISLAKALKALASRGAISGRRDGHRWKFTAAKP
ncbi:MAG TPA: hypothetical protein VMV72_14600 [Verrucomicrobiae bacterium]|nr:hypothetical protein [Verrucomicrobiae bacterium]